jgi:hypothetical protein
MVSLETGVTNASADEGVAVMRKPAAVLLVLSLAVLALALVPAVGLAAKGGNASAGGGGKPGGGGSTTGGGTISLAHPLVYDANGNGLPNAGDVVMFDVSTTATDQPFVNLKCFQNGVLVANGWKGYFAGSLDTTWGFGLGSGAWQGGAAECTAWLDMYTKQGWKQLASTSFHVDA